METLLFGVLLIIIVGMFFYFNTQLGKREKAEKEIEEKIVILTEDIQNVTASIVQLENKEGTDYLENIEKLTRLIADQKKETITNINNIHSRINELTGNSEYFDEIKANKELLEKVTKFLEVKHGKKWTDIK